MNVRKLIKKLWGKNIFEIISYLSKEHVKNPCVSDDSAIYRYIRYLYYFSNV